VLESAPRGGSQYVQMVDMHGIHTMRSGNTNGHRKRTAEQVKKVLRISYRLLVDNDLLPYRASDGRLEQDVACLQRYLFCNTVDALDEKPTFWQREVRLLGNVLGLCPFGCIRCILFETQRCRIHAFGKLPLSRNAGPVSNVRNVVRVTGPWVLGRTIVT